MITALRHCLHRWRIALSDRVRFSPLVRGLLFQWKTRFKISRHPQGAKESLAAIDALSSAARLAVTDDQIRSVEERIEALDVDLDEVRSLLAEEGDDHIPKAAILKPFNEATGEQGVIFISFEYQWARLLACRDLDEFARRYLLVVSPTWTPPHSVVNSLFPRMYPGPVFCLISNKTDLETFPRLADNYRMIDLFASSWVDPRLFDPLPHAQRDIDLVMLANFGVYKRHHVLFRALRDLPQDWKVVLVGQPNGERTAEVLLKEADAYGVRDRIVLRQRVSDEEVCDLLCRAKISLIASRREGSCVAVVESMFANTPVALVEGAQVGSATFVNAETGAFLDESRLASELLEYHQRADKMEPRQWCLDNGLDAESSSLQMNEFLKQESLRLGTPWTRDIIAMHWRPNPLPLSGDPPAWMESEAERIYSDFGVRLGDYSG